MLPAVGAGYPVAGLLGDQRGAVGVGPGVEQDLGVAGDEGAVGHDAGPHPQQRGVLAEGQEGLLGGEAVADRAARHPGEQGGDRLGLAVVLGAEAAADERHVDADAALVRGEDAGQFLAEREGVLGGAPQLDAVAPDVGDGDEGLQVEVVHPGEGEGVLEDVVAPLPDLFGAGGVPELVADVRAWPQVTTGPGAVRRDDARGLVAGEEFGGVFGEGGRDVRERGAPRRPRR